MHGSDAAKCKQLLNAHWHCKLHMQLGSIRLKLVHTAYLQVLHGGRPGETGNDLGH